MPWVGMYLGVSKDLYSWGCIVTTSERNFIDDDDRMTDCVRPQVGCYCNTIQLRKLGIIMFAT